MNNLSLSTNRSANTFASHSKKILLLIAGHLPVYLITAATTAGLFRQSNLISIILTLSFARFLLYLTRGPKPFLENYLIRKRFKRLAVDELRVSIIFLASVYIFSWSISVTTALGFISINFAGQLAGLYLSRIIYASLSKIKSDKIPTRRIIIIGSGTKAKNTADLLLDSPEIDIDLIGFLDYKREGFWRYRDIPLVGHPSELEQLASMYQLDTIFIAVENDEWIFAEKLFVTAEALGLKISVMPYMFTPKIYKTRPTYINSVPAILYHNQPEGQVALLFKTVLDKAAALVTFILAAPLILIISLLIKIDSRGPVIYKQKRSGQNGHSFTMYKFRTMIKDAEKQRLNLESKNEMSPPVFKIKNDPRLTRVGRLLRRSSLDELPQLINILKGEMSLVGPRPQLPTEVARYEPWQRRRLSFKPGLTCSWQASGRNQLDFNQWVKLDLDYIDNWSLLEDAKIIARTIPAVLKGEGAS